MEASFSIQADPRTSLLWITIGGFFGLSDIERFAGARDTELRRLRCGANQHLTLIDMRNMKIQTQGSVEAFGRLLNDRASASRRLAFVVAVGLARSQIQRAAAGRGAGYFSTVEEAEAWLQRSEAAAFLPSLKADNQLLDTSTLSARPLSSIRLNPTENIVGRHVHD